MARNKPRAFDAILDLQNGRKPAERDDLPPMPDHWEEPLDTYTPTPLQQGTPTVSGTRQEKQTTLWLGAGQEARLRALGFEHAKEFGRVISPSEMVRFLIDNMDEQAVLEGCQQIWGRQQERKRQEKRAKAQRKLDAQG